MTPQEAIDVLERERNKSHWNSLDELKQASDAWKMAIEALERQIPKKPEFVEDEYLNSFKCYCPQCGFYFGTKGKHSVVLFDMPKYCPKCGQVTDWSDAE